MGVSRFPHQMRPKSDRNSEQRRKNKHSSQDRADGESESSTSHGFYGISPTVTGSCRTAFIWKLRVMHNFLASFCDVEMAARSKGSQTSAFVLSVVCIVSGRSLSKRRVTLYVVTHIATATVSTYRIASIDAAKGQTQ